MRHSNPQRGNRNTEGPLRTGQLHLRDIDLELELLKRKRQMIEHQQQLLASRPSPFDNGYNQPWESQRQPEYNSNSNFSYGHHTRSSNNYGGSNILGKRPSNEVYQDHSTPKRFSGNYGAPKRNFSSGPIQKRNQSGSNNAYNSRQQPPANRPAPQTFQRNKPQHFKSPKSNFPSQRFTSSKGNGPSSNSASNFRPTKVTKPKPAPPANNLAKYPTPKRSNLVKEMASVSSKDNDEDIILRPDVVPSQQMAGRLELALGNILKEIRAKYCSNYKDTSNFLSIYSQRDIKYGIRERLRTAMMNKPVGNMISIVKHYRNMFPVETDDEIVQKALKAQLSDNEKRLAIRLENADTAYKYIKANMNKLLWVSLDQMFTKIQKIYDEERNKEMKPKDVCQNILSIVNENPESFKKFAAKENESNDDKKATEDEVNVSKEADDKTKAETTEPTDSSNAGASENNESQDLSSGQVDDSQANDSEVKKDDAIDVSGSENVIDITNEDNAVGNDVKADAAVLKLDDLLISLMRRRLPFMIGKFKNQMLRILSVSETYQVTKAAIVETAQQKYASGKTGANNTSKEVKTDKPAANARPKQYPYLVKILGRPVLPKRNVMQEFLNEFKPASVKKHRYMHLLFVAFENKEDFDKLVAIKETAIGNAAIFIKAGEKTAPNPDSLNTTSTLPDDSLSNSIDEQIDDLLTTIGKEDGKEEGTLNTEPAAANGANDKQGVQENNEDVQDNQEYAADNEIHEDEQAKDEVEVIEAETVHKEENGESTEARDKVEELKNDAKESGKATPTRASSRLANVTPSSIKTRRASRLAQN